MTHLNRKEINRKKRNQWTKHIENWRTSGLSQIEYCRQNQLKSSRFTYWKRTLANKVNKPAFVEVPVKENPTFKPPAKSEPLKLMVGPGIVIEINDGFNPDTLKSIVRTLRSL